MTTGPSFSAGCMRCQMEINRNSYWYSDRISDGNSERNTGVYIRRHLIAAVTRAAAFAAALAAVNMFLFGAVTVRDNDMFPQIRAGDLVVYFRPAEPAGQDAVVYETDDGLRTGRIAAAKGDIVESPDQGGITINGIPQPAQDRLGIFSETKAAENGTSYPLDLEDGQFFILGDDRDSARDSRVYGAVDRRDVKGVIFILIRRQAV